MARKRRQHSVKAKARVAIEALRERRTTSEIASKYSVHPSQVSRWKQEAVKRLPEIFESGLARGEWVDENLVSSLYQQIGKLQMEVDWLKKKL